MYLTNIFPILDRLVKFVVYTYDKNKGQCLKTSKSSTTGIFGSKKECDLFYKG